MAVEATVDTVNNDETPQQPEDGGENMDLTIIANRSELNADSALNNTEEIYKLGFSLNDLYKLSLDFYRKVKEELTLSYLDKVQLVALWKQVTSGRYSQSKLPEIGYFDVIGNDRRKAWEALADMAADVAKQHFCELLEDRCPAYVHFVNEKRAEIDAELECKRLEEEERVRLEVEERERKRKEEEERIRREEEERIRREEEEKARLATEADERRKQEEEEQKRLQEENEEDEAAANVAPADHALESATNGMDVTTTNPDVSPKLALPQVNNTHNGKKIAPASLWTRPKLTEFINHVKRDASSVLVVGRGETVTVSVPTHALGSCLFWEFATEYYDVGFGVYFEWSKDNTPDAMQQIVINENEDNMEVLSKPNTDEVLPTLRRNSHEQVIVGSHMYPGNGIYLLKFDNSYSLLRSKTLYYRVYYTK